MLLSHYSLRSKRILWRTIYLCIYVFNEMNGCAWKCWRKKSSRKKKAVVFTNMTANAYQGRLNAGFSKVCEIVKVCAIESLKYIREFHTPVCYCGDISTTRNVTLNETNCDWLFDMSVKRPHGRTLTNQCSHIFQTFSRQSEGLARRDYSPRNRETDFSPENVLIKNKASWSGLAF